MKKILLLLALIIFFVAPANAKATLVEAMTPYNSDTPTDIVVFKVAHSNLVENYGILYSGDIVEGIVIRAKDNSRLKQNATFSLKITRITQRNGNIQEPQNLYAKYTTELDKVETSKTAALTVGNFFVKGLSCGYRTVEGAVKNPEGNRFKSAGVALYNSTPLAYINKGKDILINVGDNFLLNIEVVTPEDQNIIDEHNYNL